MQPSTNFVGYADVCIVRPLLQCSKASLLQLSREERLEWVEDSSNKLMIYWRNVIRRVLEEHPELHAGLTGVIQTCNEARGILKPQGMWFVHCQW